MIRKAKTQDIPALLEIYNYEVKNGVATIGSRDWLDYSVTSTLTLAQQECAGLVARSRGHRRYYAAVLRDGCAVIEKRMDGQIIDLARAGDEEMTRVFNDYLHEVALGIASYHMVFRPEAIVLGGGISAAGEFFLDGVRRALREFQPNYS